MDTVLNKKQGLYFYISCFFHENGRQLSTEAVQNVKEYKSPCVLLKGMV